MEKYNEMRKEIINLNSSRKYADSNKKCYELIELLLFTSKDINDDLWFCYYMISNNYYLMKEYDLAIENGKYAAFVIRNYNLVNYNKTAWHLANCYRDKGNQRDAIRMYNYCAHYYRKTNNNKSRMLCLFNKAKLLNMFSIMERIRSMYMNTVGDDEIELL